MTGKVEQLSTSRKLEIKYVPINEVKPWDRNPKKHNKKAIVESLKRFKPTQPILVQKGTGLIIAGHGRLEAFKELGYEEIPIIELEMSDAEARAYALVDNQTVIAGGWDDDLLLSNLQELKLELPELDMSIFGFSDKHTEKKSEEDDFDVDAAIDADVEPITKPGDLIILGEHRLLCGDSTKKEDVERLMGGEHIDIIVTSPPYSNQRTYEIGEFDWDALMFGMSSAFFPKLKSNAHALFILGPSYKDRRVDFYWNNWLAHCESIGWPLFGMYVWDKGFGKCGEFGGRLAPTHEFIFHFNNKKGVMNKWVETVSEGKRNVHVSFRKRDGTMKPATSPDKIGQPLKIPDSVVRITKALGQSEKTGNHPAIFPVELPAFMLKTWSTKDSIVAEPFGGSGTTLIACEQLGRRCRIMEISPNYCDIIVKRYEEFTNKKAVRT